MLAQIRPVQIERASLPVVPLQKAHSAQSSVADRWALGTTGTWLCISSAITVFRSARSVRARGTGRAHRSPVAVCSGWSIIDEPKSIWDVDRAAIEAAKLKSKDSIAQHDIGVFYLPDLLPKHEFEEIRQEYKQVKHCMQDESKCGGAGESMAPGRFACNAPSKGSAERALRSRNLASQIRSRIGWEPALRAGCDFPVEYRHYTPGVGMAWHQDIRLTKPPQLELVYTIENSSDSVTRWAAGYLELHHQKVQEIWTAPNSGLLVVGEGALHMVTAPSFGHRAILKALFLQGPRSLCERSEHWDDYRKMADSLPGVN
mmetsp:Transcript_62415/g.115878  ORF Transcript_62415/g.115878 Transcript_62415/m.115878 type:complete len:316 (-) Transcript_62415:27-974(-)